MWDFEHDINVLKDYKKDIDPETFGFITDSRFYNPSCKESLHDTWLINMNLNFGKLENLLERLFEKTQVDIFLLGAYHDCIINISCMDVLEFKMKGKDAGDLLTHQFSYKKGILMHDLIFFNGNINISFRKLKIEVNELTKGDCFV